MAEFSRSKSPSILYSSLELPRVIHEMGLLLAARPCLRKARDGMGQPVMTLPGFGAGDYSTAILRSYLSRWGYAAQPWQAGSNMNPREVTSLEKLHEQMRTLLTFLTKRLEKIKAETQQPVALIGWSLGGIIARLLASRRPDLVRQVISLGTPYGDFRGTVVYPVMHRLNGGTVNEADLLAWQELTHAPLENIPLTVIYSRSDGFVAPEIAAMAAGDQVENIEVISSHVGFTVNPMVLQLIAERLLPLHASWAPYRPSGVHRLLYKVV